MSSPCRPRPGPKTAAETAAPVVATLIPQPHGGALLPGGKPGNRGGPGRPPDAHRERLRELLSQPEADEMLAKTLRGESFTFKGALVLVDGYLFLKAHAYCTERAYGKAVRETELNRDSSQRKLRMEMVHVFPESTR
jgi:hypothetical protein